MITYNGISGGQTSAYLEEHFPADYLGTSIVRLDPQKKYNIKWMKGKDEKTRQLISDRLGVEFYATAEDDVFIYTILDLEQRWGKEIKMLTDVTFDELISRKSGIPNLPQPMRRFCTQVLKIKPQAEYIKSLNIGIVESRIGFRANEMSRMKSVLNKTNFNGNLTHDFIVGKHENGNNKWDRNVEWAKPSFPLIEKKPTFKDEIIKFWKNKNIRFAWMNNCVGCMHKDPMLLNVMFEKHPEKMQWFTDRENEAKVMKGNTWRQDVEYEKIKNWSSSYKMFDDDFNECDSGYCGL